jgi:hypothetical protein
MTIQAHRSGNPQPGYLEADLEAGVSALFRRCPTLCGFAVRDAASLARDGFALGHVSELFVTEVSVYPHTGLEAPAEICREIARALVRLIDEQPEVREVLHERTFARSFH